MIADQFVPSKGIYLLNHSVGRPPHNARQAAADGFFEIWEQAAENTWPQWLVQVDRFRDALARLLNTDRDSFCPQANLSSALTKLVHALPPAPGKSTILYHQQDFPSMGFVLQAAGRSGWHSRMIAADLDPCDMNTWQQHLTPDVGVVLVTHVHSNTGARLPVADITRLAAERAVLSIVDIAQSVGIVPIDLAQWRADFVLGSCVKWLCGGPGAGFIWGRPQAVAQCQPVDLGWFSHAEPFEFDIRNFRYAPGILRFWGGTPSVLPFVVAANSIETLLEIGIARIQRHNLALTQRIIDALDPHHVVTPARPGQRGGTLVCNPGPARETIEAKLQAAGVCYDSRPTGLRMSPHIYNSSAEIDQVIRCLTP